MARLFFTRVVILTPVKPYPPTKGTGRRIMSMAEELSRLGHRVVVIYLSNPFVARRAKAEVTKVNENLLFFSSHFLSSLVLTEMLRASIIQFEYPYLLPSMLLARAFGKPIILDEHGVEAIFVRELKRIPKEYCKNLSIGLILKTVPGLSYLVPILERLAVGMSRIVFACSAEEADTIRRLYKVNQVRVVPNCADRTFFERVTPHYWGRPTVIFLGSFEHLPNLEGASILLKQIAPRVIKRIDAPLFVLIGKNPPKWLTREANRNVVFTGEVSEIRPLVSGADVAVTPVFSGAGTRQKMLDYMALGKAIVSTSKGAEGLQGLKDGVQLLLRDNVKEFSDGIIELLLDKPRTQRLGYNAREIAKARYSWHTQIGSVLDAYNDSILTEGTVTTKNRSETTWTVG